jgi:tRNA pseudouridine13 synthase
MKLKQQPDDFQVEELTDLQPGGEGHFSFYCLEKRGWNTPDALAVLRRRWKIEPQRLSYGGLKDRHAWTIQYLTIRSGPQRDFSQQNITVRYLGKMRTPYLSQHIRANRFRITLRDLTGKAAAGMQSLLPVLARAGVPNYFDDQRFGSLRPNATSTDFVGRLLVEGRFEDALRQALAAPYEFDRASDKEEKRLLLAHWGDWLLLKEHLPRSHARSLVDYLRVHPGDFRGAVARLRPELRSLYLSIYQSWLWNRLLARWLEQHTPAEQLRSLPLRLGPVPVHQDLEDAQLNRLRELSLPLPSSRLRLEPTDPLLELVNGVLAEEGLELARLKVPGLRDLFFSRGERAALVQPSNLAGSMEPDEVHQGRYKMVLTFDLPRGSYATMLVKRLQHADG